MATKKEVIQKVYQIMDIIGTDINFEICSEAKRLLDTNCINFETCKNHLPITLVIVALRNIADQCIERIKSVEVKKEILLEIKNLSKF